MNAFLRPIVARGLAKLSVLNLPGRPASADMTAVAEVWLESLLRHRQDWQPDLDALRLDKAFCRLIDHSEAWPNPRDLITALPPRSLPKALNSPPLTREKRAENRKKLQEILKNLNQTKRIKP